MEIRIEELKKQCNIDSSMSDDDELLARYLDTAKAIVQEDTGRSEEELTSDNYQHIYRQAVLIKASDMYAFRESTYNGTISTIAQAYNRLISLIRKWGNEQ